MSANAGVVIVDANTLGAFESDEAFARVQANLRVADLELWVSAMNLLEVLRNENPHVRRRLLATLEKLRGDRVILPWPMDLLKLIGGAMLNNRVSLKLGEYGLEHILTNPHNVSDDDVLEVKSYLETQEAEFNRMHGEARGRLQPELKKRELLNQWESIPSFLDTQWMLPELITPILEKAWESLGLPMPAPPVQDVFKNESWRLYFEGFGAAVFERGIMVQQPRRVQNADILQLIYLAGAPRRILVTNDTGLHRVASSILKGRYADAAVITSNEWLS